MMKVLQANDIQTFNRKRGGQRGGSTGRQQPVRTRERQLFRPPGLWCGGAYALPARFGCANRTGY